MFKRKTSHYLKFFVTNFPTILYDWIFSSRHTYEKVFVETKLNNWKKIAPAWIRTQRYDFRPIINRSSPYNMFWIAEIKFFLDLEEYLMKETSYKLMTSLITIFMPINSVWPILFSKKLDILELMWRIEIWLRYAWSIDKFSEY